MNWVKKLFPMCVVVLSVLLLCGTGFAQNTQTVTLVPSATAVDPGASFDVNVNYNCTKKVSNFSIQIYYDATMVTFGSVTVNYDQGLLVNPPEHNTTEHKIVISYMDIMGAWPTAALPLNNVVTLNFTANAGTNGAATFTIVDKAELPNMTFVGEPLNVTVGDVQTCADVLQGVTIASVPVSGTAPLTVTLNAAVTGTADGYTWTVKDASGNDITGYPKTTAVPTLTDVVLTDVGAYTAYVIASNSTILNCSVNTELAPATITVTSASLCDLTAAVITAAPANGTAPLDVVLSATVTGTADTYAWNVTNAAGVSLVTGTDATLNLTDLPAGVYTATLTVSNSAIAGCSVTAAPATVTVTPAGLCDLTAAVITATPANGTAPLDVVLSATVTGTADTYAWNVTNAAGVSLVTGTNATLNLAALPAGVYTANLTVSNSAIAGCSVTAAPATITVTGANQCPTVAGIKATPANGTAPLDVVLSAIIIGGTVDTYTWNVANDAGAIIDAGTNATLNLTDLPAGNYTVSLTVSNSTIPNCSLDADPVVIQVSSSGVTPDGDGDCNGGVVDVYDALLAAQMDTCTNNGVFDEACFNALVAPITTAELCLDMLDVEGNMNGVDINDALAIALFDVDLPCSCVLDQP